ncbi:hypothetical protein SDC9_137176 [bioreactor metagenome]|uniref:Uncharacterized protein n=1 Tax=bioreactor metagenome TaxID=1076179 RepID=A0A645DKT8_9ZZZZ
MVAYFTSSIEEMPDCLRRVSSLSIDILSLFKFLRIGLPFSTTITDFPEIKVSKKSIFISKYSNIIIKTVSTSATRKVISSPLPDTG